MKKRVVIISAISLVVLITLGILIYYLINRDEIVEASNPMKTNLLVPNIAQNEFTYNLSNTEETTENVIFSITSRETTYPIYYAVVEINEDSDVEDVKNEDYFLYENEVTIESNSYILLKYKDGEKYSNIPYKIEIKNIISSKEETVSQEELDEAKLEEEEKTNDAPYYIKVNYGANVVTIYKKDANNEYTIPFKAMVCSTGKATPKSGVYKLPTTRYVWRRLFGDVYGQYATKIVGQILFHSVPYLSNEKDTLKYAEYDKLGTTASAGCIRLTVKDAKWIYNNCAAGTMVEFYSSSNPGPLGKPSSQKISQYTNLRDWDPTDPDPNNPWNGGNLEQEKQPEQNNNQEIQQPTEKPTPDEEINQDQNTTPDSGNNNESEVDNEVNKEEDENKKPEEDNLGEGNQGSNTDGDKEEINPPTEPDLDPTPEPEVTPNPGVDNEVVNVTEDIQNN